MTNLLTATSKAILSLLRSHFGITPQKSKIDVTVMGKDFITCCSTNLGGYEIILNAMMCVWKR